MVFNEVVFSAVCFVNKLVISAICFFNEVVFSAKEVVFSAVCFFIEIGFGAIWFFKFFCCYFFQPFPLFRSENLYHFELMLKVRKIQEESGLERGVGAFMDIVL